MMKKTIALFWRSLGSIHLTVALSLLLTCDLAWGYLCLNRHATLFDPLNEVGLPTWIATYGRHNPGQTTWLLVLMGLLTLLCANTFVCTTDRVAKLFAMGKRMSPRRLFFRFAPHVMHYAVIVILAGYLASYIFAQVEETRVLLPGTSLTLPGTEASVLFESSDPLYYEKEGLPALEGRILQPRAKLVLTDGEKRESVLLGYNRPVRFKGYGIFLKAYYPYRKSGGMSDTIRINLGIRKDPGVSFYFFGIIMFSAGLFMYLADLIFFKRK